MKTLKEEVWDQLQKALILLVAMQDDGSVELKEIRRQQIKVRTLEDRLEELTRQGL